MSLWKTGLGGALQQIKHQEAGASPVDVVVVAVLEGVVAAFAPDVDAEEKEVVHRAEDDGGHERVQVVGGHEHGGGLRWGLQQKGYLDAQPLAG